MLGKGSDWAGIWTQTGSEVRLLYHTRKAALSRFINRKSLTTIFSRQFTSIENSFQEAVFVIAEIKVMLFSKGKLKDLVSMETQRFLENSRPLHWHQLIIQSDRNSENFNIFPLIIPFLSIWVLQGQNPILNRDFGHITQWL